jgi:hypothetical protein
VRSMTLVVGPWLGGGRTADGGRKAQRRQERERKRRQRLREFLLFQIEF